MKSLSFFLITSLIFSGLTAQNFTFGKVSKEELKETYNPADSSAEATILYRNENIYFDIVPGTGIFQHREVHMRVKIYNSEGFDWANDQVLLYDGRSDSKEKLSGLKGYTYNLEGNSIKKEKLTKDAIFEEQVSDYLVKKSFTMPNIKEGSVIEYKYEIYSEFIVIDDIYLQFPIPTKKLDVSISTPQFYRYSLQLNPRAYYMPRMLESVESKSLVTAGYGGSSSYKNNIVKINENDIEALKAESYAGNIENYRAKLAMELSAYLNDLGVEEKSFATTWSEVSETIYKSSRFGEQIKKSSFYKDDLVGLLEGVEDDFDKANRIQEFVKSKVKWNGYPGMFTQKGVRTAYKEGAGNVADVNLLLLSMLLESNCVAFPVLVSTSDNGIPLFPTMDGFNYVVVLVKNGDNMMLLDATEPLSANGIMPLRVLNWQGRVIYDVNSSDWINLNPRRKSVESGIMNFKFTEDFTIEGSIRKNLTDYLALKQRQSYAGVTEADQIKSLESNKGNIEISDLDYKELENPYKNLGVSYAFELSDMVDNVGDKLYFNPLLFLNSDENPFKLDTRNYPIDFRFPIEFKYKINIMLPEGYSVVSIPKSQAYVFKSEDHIKYTYTARQNGQYLQLSTNLSIATSIVTPADYEEFKLFYSKMIEKQQEQVVLSKSEL